MPRITLDEIEKSYFLFGCLKEPAPPEIKEKLNTFSGQIHYIPIDSYGNYFYTLPFYADKAENDEIVLIKLGFFHNSEKLISAQTILNNGWVTTSSVDADQIEGDGALIGFYKREPGCFIYRNLLSASVIHYFNNEDLFIASDNLRLISMFQPMPELNEDIIAQHFIYRQIYGRETYFKGISRLLVGEMLSWNPLTMTVDLKRDFRAFIDSGNQKSVTTDSINWFFDQFKHIVGIYLEGCEMSSATMLSGGIDSSLVQAAINTQIERGRKFPSYSFVIDSPGFAYEVEYAKEGSQALNTQHTFVKLTPDQYAQGIVQSTEILGEPMPDDVRSCFYLLADHLARNYADIKYLFHGGHADGLHGGSRAARVIQGDKYKSWPVPLLEILAGILVPISQSKSYGARTAADMIRKSKDDNSRNHYLNSSAVYTDWVLMEKCFPASAIKDAFERKRNIEAEYLDSNHMVEKVSTLGLLTIGIRQRALERTMGHFRNVEYIYPYGDEAIVKASYSFAPLERYIYDYRTKPILKAALESQTSDFELDKPKGWSGYGMAELFGSMKDGELSEMVQAIERPGFITKADFEEKLRHPDWFTWNLLTLDLFKKTVLGD